MTSPVVICYRRDDTLARAGRLRDGIAGRFSDDTVFFDHSSIASGAVWPDELRDKLQAAAIVLAVIGPQWMTCRGDHGRRRIDEDGDWVRREIETSLAEDKYLVPLLVGGAGLPPADGLPDSLKPMLSRQSLPLRDEYWHHDLELVYGLIRSKMPADSREKISGSPYPVPPDDVPDPIGERQLEAALAGPLKDWCVRESPLPENPEKTRVELFRAYSFRRSAMPSVSCTSWRRDAILPFITRAGRTSSRPCAST